MDYRALLEQKEKLRGEAAELIDEAEKLDRKQTKEEREKITAVQAEIDEVIQEIAIREKQREHIRNLDLDKVIDEHGLGGTGKTEAQKEGFQGDHALGEFLSAVARAEGSSGRAVDPRLESSDLYLQAAASGLSEGIPSDGGYFVQQNLASTLLKRTYDAGQIASRCFKLPIGPGFNGTKINAIAETSRATGSRWGGVRGYWLAEGDTITDSKPKFRQVELNLKKLGALVYATDENLQDAPQLERIVMDIVPQELNFLLENAIINGTGGGMPTGLLSSGAVIAVAKVSGQTAATFVYRNALDMWARMHAPSRSNAVWLVDQSVEPELYSMSLAIGTGGAPVYLPAGGASGAPYATLFGRPIIPHEHGQALGTAGDVILADLSQYALIEKGGVQAASSMHVKFTADEMTFRFIYRVDGMPLWNSALTPKSGGSTVAPFLTVLVRS